MMWLRVLVVAQCAPALASVVAGAPRWDLLLVAGALVAAAVHAHVTEGWE